MQVLETWLTETSWGSDITPDVAVPEDDPNLPTTEGQGTTTPVEPPSEGSGEEDLDEGYELCHCYDFLVRILEQT